MDGTLAEMKDGVCQIRFFETLLDARKHAWEWNRTHSDKMRRHAQAIKMGAGLAVAVFEGTNIVGYLGR